MKLRDFVIACAVIGVGVAANMAPAYSQLYNDPKNAATPVPVFVAPQHQNTQPQTYNQAGVQEIPNKPATTTQEIIDKNKLIAQQNDLRSQQWRDSANAAYAASVAAENSKQAAEQAKKGLAAKGAGYAAQGTVAGQAAAAPAPIMVFTGAKKTDDKPARLFNVQ